MRPWGILATIILTWSHASWGGLKECQEHAKREKKKCTDAQSQAVNDTGGTAQTLGNGTGKVAAGNDMAALGAAGKANLSAARSVCEDSNSKSYDKCMDELKKTANGKEKGEIAKIIRDEQEYYQGVDSSLTRKINGAENVVGQGGRDVSQSAHEAPPPGSKGPTPMDPNSLSCQSGLGCKNYPGYGYVKTRSLRP